MKFIPVFFLASVITASTSAHCNLFLPVDSFFGSSIADTELDFDEEKLDAIFEYQAFSGTFMFCGYAGYGSLRLLDIPESFTENLKKAEGFENDKISDAKVLFLWSRS